MCPCTLCPAGGRLVHVPAGRGGLPREAKDVRSSALVRPTTVDTRFPRRASRDKREARRRGGCGPNARGASAVSHARKSQIRRFKPRTRRTHTHKYIPQISGTHVCLRLLGMNSGQTRLSPSPLSVSPSRAHSCSRADAIAIDSAHSRPRVVRLCGAAALLEEKRDASGAEGGNRGRGL